MYNYHTHTKRCNHAKGEDEEYVLEAILAKYEGLGFSDHIMLPNISGSYVRGDYQEKDDYLKSIENLKEKYKEQIEIYVGFECEWDNHYQKYYKSLLDNHEVDYLIFGNHSNYFKKNKEYGLKIKSAKSYLKRYLVNTEKALKSGLFKIMAHPDIFMSSVRWNEDSKKAAIKICKLAKKYNVVLELNCGCIINEGKKQLFDEYRYRYPYDKFWKIAKKVGNDIIVGIDAHFPQALNCDKINIMNEFISTLNLKVLSKIESIKTEGEK